MTIPSYVDPKVLKIMERPHTQPAHHGWKQYCQTCRELKELADQMTGIVSSWQEDGRVYYPRDKR